MPNYAINRLTLTGPVSELMRFERECIRVQRDDPSGGRSLDFEAIVPVPLELVATFEDQSDEARQAAEAATGYNNWYNWCVAAWGTKWNADTLYADMIDGMIYDCIFETAWSCPEPTLRALASKYPALSGTIVAGEQGNDWCLVGTIQHGAYTSSTSAYDPQVDLLACGGYQGSQFPVASAHALIESVAGGGGEQVGGDLTVPDRLRTIIAALDKRLPHSPGRRFYFERTTLDVVALLDAGQSLWDIRKRNLGQHDGAAEHVAFLLANDRLRTALDRQLLSGMATALRDEALVGSGGSETVTCSRRAWIEDYVLPDYDEGDLRAWAAMAMYRPGVLIDIGDAEALKRNVFDYADGLHADVLAYLDGQVAELQGKIQAAQLNEHLFEEQRFPS